MKKLTIDSQKVRHFDVILHHSLRDKHNSLIMEFLKRGVSSPRGGSSGPYFKNHKAVEGYSRYIFMLDDSPTTEYDETAADEYLRRMKEKQNEG